MINANVRELLLQSLTHEKGGVLVYSTALECVRVEHTELLRALFRGSLTDDEVAQLSELLGRLRGVGAGSCAG